MGRPCADSRRTEVICYARTCGNLFRVVCCARTCSIVSSMMYVVISNMPVAASPRGPLQAARIRRSATRAPPVVYESACKSPGWVAMPHAACDVSAVSAGILLDYTRSVTRRWPRRAAKLAPISITLQNYNLRQSSPPFPTGGEWDCPPIRGRSRR